MSSKKITDVVFEDVSIVLVRLLVKFLYISVNIKLRRLMSQFIKFTLDVKQKRVQVFTGIETSLSPLLQSAHFYQESIAKESYLTYLEVIARDIFIFLIYKRY